MPRVFVDYALCARSSLVYECEADEQRAQEHLCNPAYTMYECEADEQRAQEHLCIPAYTIVQYNWVP